MARVIHMIHDTNDPESNRNLSIYVENRYVSSVSAFDTHMIHTIFDEQKGEKNE